MKNNQTKRHIGAAALLLACVQMAAAAVTPEEAAKLKSTLTPMGAEMAANKDGSIPRWTGGLSKGDWKKDLFPQEQPLVQITAANMAQHADKLSDGVQALLKKYPDTYRVDVYPTHRTVGAHQWIYDNTFKNATRAKTTEGGLSVEGAYGGVPFPITTSGIEVMWNHVLRPRLQSVDFLFRNVVGNADGTFNIASEAKQSGQNPFYAKDGSADNWSGEYLWARQVQVAPPFKAGESLVIRDSVNKDQSRQAWQYLVGQRRVRRAPTVGYDTPDFVSSGANYFDEPSGFMGALDRYDWNLVEKKEMYVPYNNNKFAASKLEDAIAVRHLNPDKVRWERHRVWVVDATLAAGKRHAVPKRRFYIDEDSWSVLLVDGFDAAGKLWRTNQVLPYVFPEDRSLMLDTTMIHNLQANTWSLVLSINDRLSSYKILEARPSTYFTGDALSSDSMR